MRPRDARPFSRRDRKKENKVVFLLAKYFLHIIQNTSISNRRRKLINQRIHASRATKFFFNYLQIHRAAVKRVSAYWWSSGQQTCNVAISGEMLYSANARATIAMDDVLSRMTDTHEKRKAMTGPQNRWRGESNASLK